MVRGRSRRARRVSCREVVEGWQGDLPQDGAEARLVEFRRHLARCASCRAWAETYRTTIDLVRALRDEPGVLRPEEASVLWGALRRRLRSPSSGGAPRRRGAGGSGSGTSC